MSTSQASSSERTRPGLATLARAALPLAVSMAAALPLAALTLPALILAVFTPRAASAADFHLEDPMGANAATFRLDSRLNAIVGTAAGISGVVRFDPAHPELTNGDIYVDTASIQLTNPEWNLAVKSADWLDSENYPKMSIALKAVREVEEVADGVWTLQAMGGIVCRGKVARLDAPIQISFIPGGMEERTDGAIPGDLLVLRTSFVLRRSDLGLDRTPIGPGKLADEIQIQASLIGHTR